MIAVTQKLIELVIVFDLRHRNHKVEPGILYTALYDPLLIGSSDIAEVRLKEVVTDQPLKLSRMFTLVMSQYLRDRNAGIIVTDAVGTHPKKSNALT